MCPCILNKGVLFFDCHFSLLLSRIRTRDKSTVTEEEEMYRVRLLKQWCLYKKRQSIAEIYMLDSLQNSTNRALEVC